MSEIIKIAFSWCLSQIILVTFLSLTIALPVDHEAAIENNARIGSNQLFQQLNDIIKHQIEKEVKKEPHIGDKVEDDDKSFQISVQQFSSFDSFPVDFKPKDEEVLEDKTIIAIVDDFDGSSEFIIMKEGSNEDKTTIHPDETTKKPDDSSTTIKAPTTLRATSDTTKPSSTSTQEHSTQATSTNSSDSQTSTPSSSLSTSGVKFKRQDEPIVYFHK